MASLRTYNTSIVAYQTTYGTDPATSLSQLGPATTPSASAADLVDILLGPVSGTPTKSGYTFTYAVTAGTPTTQYTIIAAPVSASTGQRLFFTNQSGVIRQTTDGSTPTVTSTPIGG